METYCIALKDFRDEVKALLGVCFEGIVCEANGELELRFPNGQRFSVFVEEEK